MKAARTRALNRKHAGTAKHSSTAKHTGSASRKGATAHKQVAKRAAATVKAAHLRAWSPGGASCCSAEALAASLRALGRPVAAQDVIALYERTADSPDAGASIVATLDAAWRFGLGGVRPVSYEPFEGLIVGDVAPAGALHAGQPRGLLLGLDMPEGRHTVALDPSGDVWSWGGLHELTGEAVIEEAWAVTW